MAGLDSLYGGSPAEVLSKALSGSSGASGFNPSALPSDYKDPFALPAPAEGSPESTLAQKFAPAQSAKSLPPEQEAAIQKQMDENTKQLQSNSGFIAGMFSAWDAGSVNSKVNRAIGDASQMGDTEGIDYLSKWLTDFNQQRDELVKAADPNPVESALYSTAQSMPFIIRLGIGNLISHKVASMAGSGIASSISDTTVAKTISDFGLKQAGKIATEEGGKLVVTGGVNTFLSRTILKGAIADLATKFAARTAVAGTLAAEEGPLQATPVGWLSDITMGAVIAGMTIYDAIQITRNLTKDEQTGQLELKKSPFLVSPAGQMIYQGLPEMEGQHYSELINQGIPAKYINGNAIRATALLESAVMATYNPFVAVNQGLASVAQSVGKAVLRGAEGSGATALKYAGMWGATTTEMASQMGVMGAVGTVGMNKEIARILKEHPEIATAAALQANQSAVGDTSVKDIISAYVTSMKEALPVSMVFGVMGIPQFALAMHRNSMNDVQNHELSKQTDAKVNSVPVEQVKAAHDALLEKNSGQPFGAWTTPDLMELRGYKARLEASTPQGTERSIYTDGIKEIDSSIIKGDIVQYLDKHGISKDEQASIFAGGQKKEVIDRLLENVNADRKENGRPQVPDSASIEYVFGNEYPYATDLPDSTVNVVSDIKQTKALLKKMEDDPIDLAKKGDLIQFLRGKVEGLDNKTPEEVSAAVRTYIDDTEKTNAETASTEKEKGFRDAADIYIKDHPVSEEDKKLTPASLRQDYYNKFPKEVTDRIEFKDWYRTATGTDLPADTSAETSLFRTPEERSAMVERTKTEGMPVRDQNALVRTPEGRAALKEAFPQHYPNSTVRGEILAALKPENERRIAAAKEKVKADRAAKKELEKSPKKESPITEASASTDPKVIEAVTKHARLVKDGASAKEREAALAEVNKALAESKANGLTQTAEKVKPEKTDILSGKGNPFTKAQAALTLKAKKLEGTHEIKELEGGGWVIRKKTEGVQETPKDSNTFTLKDPKTGNLISGPNTFVVSKNTKTGVIREETTDPSAESFGAKKQGEPEGAWRVTVLQGDSPLGHETFDSEESARSYAKDRNDKFYKNAGINPDTKIQNPPVEGSVQKPVEQPKPELIKGRYRRVKGDTVINKPEASKTSLGKQLTGAMSEEDASTLGRGWSTPELSDRISELTSKGTIDEEKGIYGYKEAGSGETQLADVSRAGIVHTSIPVEYLKEDGVSLKDGVIARWVAINGKRAVYDNPLVPDFADTANLNALQLADLKGELPDYNIALAIVQEDMQGKYPAKVELGHAKATALGWFDGDKKGFTVIGSEAVERDLSALMDKAGIETGGVSAKNPVKLAISGSRENSTVFTSQEAASRYAITLKDELGRVPAVRPVEGGWKLYLTGNDKSKLRTANMYNVATYELLTGKAKYLFDAYERALGEGGKEGRTQQTNSNIESLLAQVIKEHYLSFKQNGSKSTILKFLDGTAAEKASITGSKLRDAVRRAIVDKVGYILEQAEGDYEIKTITRELNYQAQYSREETIGKLRDILDYPNLNNPSSNNKMFKKGGMEDYSNLLQLLADVLRKRGILKQDLDVFFGKDVEARKQTLLYKSLDKIFSAIEAGKGEAQAFFDSIYEKIPTKEEVTSPESIAFSNAKAALDMAERRKKEGKGNITDGVIEKLKADVSAAEEKWILAEKPSKVSEAAGPKTISSMRELAMTKRRYSRPSRINPVTVSVRDGAYNHTPDDHILKILGERMGMTSEKDLSRIETASALLDVTGKIKTADKENIPVYKDIQTALASALGNDSELLGKVSDELEKMRDEGREVGIERAISPIIVSAITEPDAKFSRHQRGTTLVGTGFERSDYEGEKPDSEAINELARVLGAHVEGVDEEKLPASPEQIDKVHTEARRSVTAIETLRRFTNKDSNVSREQAADAVRDIMADKTVSKSIRPNRIAAMLERSGLFGRGDIIILRREQEKRYEPQSGKVTPEQISVMTSVSKLIKGVGSEVWRRDTEEKTRSPMTEADIAKTDRNKNIATHQEAAKTAKELTQQITKVGYLKMSDRALKDAYKSLSVIRDTYRDAFKKGDRSIWTDRSETLLNRMEERAKKDSGFADRIGYKGGKVEIVKEGLHPITEQLNRMRDERMKDIPPVSGVVPAPLKELSTDGGRARELRTVRENLSGSISVLDGLRNAEKILSQKQKDSTAKEAIGRSVRDARAWLESQGIKTENKDVPSLLSEVSNRAVVLKDFLANPEPRSNAATALRPETSEERSIRIQKELTEEQHGVDYADEKARTIIAAKAKKILEARKTDAIKSSDEVLRGLTEAARLIGRNDPAAQDIINSRMDDAKEWLNSNKVKSFISGKAHKYADKYGVEAPFVHRTSAGKEISGLSRSIVEQVANLKADLKAMDAAAKEASFAKPIVERPFSRIDYIPNPAFESAQVLDNATRQITGHTIASEPLLSQYWKMGKKTLTLPQTATLYGHLSRIEHDFEMMGMNVKLAMRDDQIAALTEIRERITKNKADRAAFMADKDAQGKKIKGSVGGDFGDAVNAHYQDAKPNVQLSYNEAVAHLTGECLRNGIDMKPTDGGILLTGPNGKQAEFRYVEGQVEEGKAGKLTTRFGLPALIQISQIGSDVGTINHELAHWAHSELMTERERFVVDQVYGGPEGWAKEMENYKEENVPVKYRSAMNKIVNKIANFFRVMLCRPVRQVDQAMEDAKMARDVAKEYQSGAFFRRTNPDEGGGLPVRTKAELDKMSRSELQTAYRAHKEMLSRAGIELHIDERTGSDEQLKEQLSRKDPYLSFATNIMPKTAVGRRMMGIISTVPIKVQISPSALFDLIGDFDGTGIIHQITANYRKSITEKAAPIRARLDSIMAGTLTHKELKENYDITLGGKKVSVKGGMIAALHAASMDEGWMDAAFRVEYRTTEGRLTTGTIMKEDGENVVIKKNDDTLETVKRSALLPDTQNKISFETSNRKTEDAVLSRDDFNRLKGILPSEQRFKDAWKTYSKASADALVPVTEYVKQTKSNWLGLGEDYHFKANKDGYFAIMYAEEARAAGGASAFMSGTPSILVSREGAKTRSSLIVPSMEEFMEGHSRAVSKIAGSGRELQDIHEMLYGPNGSGTFLKDDSFKGWTVHDAVKMRGALQKAFEQTLRSGKEADTLMRNPFVRYLKQGQDLFRLSNIGTLLKMSSSSHLITPFLKDPTNYGKALLMPKINAVAEKYFRADSFLWSRGESRITAQAGDPYDRTAGRTVLSNESGRLGLLQSAPAMADRHSMRTIFLSVALDELPNGMPRNSHSIATMEGNTEYWARVTSKANALTLKTQATYESFLRSDLLNRGSLFSMMLTRYGTQQAAMLNMLLTSYSRMATEDSPQARKQFEKTAMSCLGTNTLVLAGITVGATAFADMMRAMIRGNQGQSDEDKAKNEILLPFEKKDLKTPAGQRYAEQFLGSSLNYLVQTTEGGDEAARIAQAAYGAWTGKDYLVERGTQGQFVASELGAIYGALKAAGTLGRESQKMTAAESKGNRSAYMESKRVYAYNGEKLYRMMMQLIGVGFHLPTKMLNDTLTAEERVRKSMFDKPSSLDSMY